MNRSCRCRGRSCPTSVSWKESAMSDLQAVAFAKLSESQLAGLAGCPKVKLRRFRAGEKLFEVGERDFRFFVVQSGEVEIVQETCTARQTIVIHRRGDFTGEVAQLGGADALVTAVARVDSEVFEISREALREMLNLHPDLGDIILQAFLARRQLLRDSGVFTGLRVIGAAAAPDTFRVRDFLNKNRVPFAWLDPEADPKVQQLLDHFQVGAAETPVVAW